jgi:ABC-type glutathione transport system ATPase component
MNPASSNSSLGSSEHKLPLGKSTTPLELDLTHSIKPTKSENARQNGLVITFKDLSYTVTNTANKKEKLALLENVSAFFRPGEMSALMGPSGEIKAVFVLHQRSTCKQAGVPTTTLYVLQSRHHHGFTQVLARPLRWMC